MSNTVKFKKLRETAHIPTKGSEYSAGFDLYADVDNQVTIDPHKTQKIPTGLSFEIPEGYFGAIFARSGLATYKGARPANCVGVCDSDYRGEYIVALHNDSDTPVTVEHHDRIAQLVILPYYICDLEETTDELSTTDRGSNGFGSTGR